MAPARRIPRLAWWLATLVFVVVLASLALSRWIGEPLRQRIEAGMNAKLDGYTVRIGTADFHPLGFAIDLEDLILIQDAHPDPPVGRLPRLGASVQWRAIFFGDLVADFRFEEPELHIDRRHLRTEVEDDVPVADRGWQEAAYEIYPLEINEIVIAGGRLTYIDDDPERPLELADVDLVAENIRNVRSPDRTYPSEVRLEARVFEKGSLEMEGRADFLAAPHLGIKTTLALAEIDLTRFAPILARFGGEIRQGSLAAAGELEYAPSVKTARLGEVTLDRLDVAYTKGPQREEARRLVAATAEKARAVSNEPGVLLEVERLHVKRSTVAYTDQTRAPPYTLFVAAADGELANLSNHRTRGEATMRLDGLFMGSGAAHLAATFRPEQEGANFEADLQIESTDLTTMNDLLRAYGNFDVARGRFSLYSEVDVADGQIDGYVKPLFTDVDVYDRAQEADDGILQKAYEGVVGGVASLFRNQPRDQVATRTSIAGPVGATSTSTWEIVARLVQNAFFQAILPGLETSAPGRRDDDDDD